jgi:hypothetical protein
LPQGCGAGRWGLGPGEGEPWLPTPTGPGRGRPRLRHASAGTPTDRGPRLSSLARGNGRALRPGVPARPAQAPTARSPPAGTLRGCRSSRAGSYPAVRGLGFPRRGAMRSRPTSSPLRSPEVPGTSEKFIFNELRKRSCQNALTVGYALTPSAPPGTSLRSLPRRPLRSPPPPGDPVHHHVHQHHHPRQPPLHLGIEVGKERFSRRIRGRGRPGNARSGAGRRAG